MNYREAYGMHACDGVLCNHELLRRSKALFMRTITRAKSSIYQGVGNGLHSGTLNARQDWGYALDYVRFQWPFLQQDGLDDCVILTNGRYSEHEFFSWAAGYPGIELGLLGKGLSAVGIVVNIPEFCQTTIKYQAVST